MNAFSSSANTNARFPKRAVFVLIGMLVGLLSACDRKTDVDHLNSAIEFQKAGNLSASVIELKNALGKNPDNPEARRLLGVILAKSGNGAAAAEKELKRALELGVPRETALLPLAEAFLLQDKYQDVLDLGESAAGMSPAQYAELRSYRGNAWSGLNQPEKALEEYTKALEIDEHTALAKAGLARIAASRQEFAKAHQLLAQALEDAPNNVPIMRMQADLFHTEGKLAEAESGYTQVIDSNRATPQDVVTRTLIRIDLKRFDEAAKDVAYLKANAPNQFLTSYAAGMLAFTQNRFTDAQTELTDSMRANDRYAPTLFLLGSTYYWLGHLEQADEWLSRYLAAVPGSVQGIRMLALTKFSKNEYVRAREILMPVVKQRPTDIFSLLLMGQIEFALGQGEKGLEYFQKVIELSPDSPNLLTQLASGYLSTGDSQKGLEALKIATKVDPNFVQADMLATLSYINSNQLDKAAESVNKLKEKMSNSPIPSNLMGVIYRHQGRMDEARSSFKEALALKPGWSVPALNLAQIDQREKNYGEARKALEETAKINPNNLQLQLRLAELDALDNKAGDMQARLDSAAKAHPEAVEPRLILARFYIRSGMPQRALALLEDVLTKHRQNIDALAVLTEAQLANEQPRRAVESAMILVGIAPKLPSAHFLLGQAYADSGDAGMAEKAITKALQLDPRYFPARLAIVRIMALSGKSDAAKKQLGELTKEYPDNIEVISLGGWMAMHQKKFGDAVKTYQKLIKMRPDSQGASDLAQAHWLNGERELAIRVLEDWLDKNPADTNIRYLLSMYYREIGNPQDSIGQLEKIIEQNPNHVMALSDLAWEIREKEPQKALELAEKAAQSAGSAPLVLDTLGMVLLKNKQEERALNTLGKAHDLDPENRQISYHHALALVQNSRIPDAVENLEALTSKKGEFPDKADALRLLNQLKGGGEK